MADNLIEISSITKSYKKPNDGTQIILDNIDFYLKEGEILAIVGKSGCGKSTLLKIIAGLNDSTKGAIKLSDKIKDKDFAISMVFQTFALFPWLTVLENVELGLESLKLTKSEKSKKAIEAIDLIGLDGFETAMPRELSSGMKQRVGFARALVVNSEILLMDEPFSALDVLTANSLKNDFLNLWNDKKTNLKSVLIVTKSIEEIVEMADRVLIFSSKPGSIASEIKINLARPRIQNSAEFREVVDNIYSEIVSADETIIKKKKQNIADNLIFSSPNQLAATAALLLSPPYEGQGDIAELGGALNIDNLDMIHAAEDLNILKLATTKEGEITLTQIGINFAEALINERKAIFARQLITNVPLASYILNILNEAPDNIESRRRFENDLKNYFLPEEAAKAIESIITAGRYAEIFTYNNNKQTFSL